MSQRLRYGSARTLAARGRAHSRADIPPPVCWRSFQTVSAQLSAARVLEYKRCVPQALQFAELCVPRPAVGVCVGAGPAVPRSPFVRVGASALQRGEPGAASVGHARGREGGDVDAVGPDPGVGECAASGAASLPDGEHAACARTHTRTHMCTRHGTHTVLGQAHPAALPVAPPPLPRRWRRSRGATAPGMRTCQGRLSLCPRLVGRPPCCA